MGGGVAYLKVEGGVVLRGSSQNKRSKPDLKGKLWFSIGAFVPGRQDGTGGGGDSDA